MVGSFFSAATVLALSARTVKAGLYPGLSNLNHTCSLQDPVLSCSAGAVPGKVDSCCVETFGGLVLATQFWDVYTGYESKGQVLPEDSWTIHGLWPDFCNGSYTQYCDLKRQYDPHPSPNTTNGLRNGTVVPAYTGPTVDNFIKALGRYDLLAYMNKYWIAQNQPNTELWAHEFSKHATCFSSYDTECYGPKYVEHEELVEYYEDAINFYQETPTWDWLASEGIKPSNKTTYTLKKIQKALSDNFGAIPYVGCSGPRYNTTAAGAGTTDRGFTYLSEVWYYTNVYGRPQNGEYVVVNASSTFLTNCAQAAGAISYFKRAPGSEVAYDD